MMLRAMGLLRRRNIQLRGRRGCKGCGGGGRVTRRMSHRSGLGMHHARIPRLLDPTRQTTARGKSRVAALGMTEAEKMCRAYGARNFVCYVSPSPYGLG